MDTEAWKSLGTLLLWGVLFFFMMRFGCGAHMMGGHGHHGGHRKHDDDSTTTDPVCGMDVSADSAKATTVFRGKTYYFCSISCRDNFDAAPEKYADASRREGHHHA